MFKNVGKKLRSLGSFLFWFVLVASIITAIVLLAVDAGDLVGIAIGVVVAGPISAYCTALLLHGFGIIVSRNENGIDTVTNSKSHDHKQANKESIKLQNESAAKDEGNMKKTITWGNADKDDGICSVCGEKKAETILVSSEAGGKLRICQECYQELFPNQP